MNYIPHDYYLKFMDSLVYQEVLDFHVKGNYTIHEAFSHATHLHNIDEHHLSLLTGNELRLYPDMDLTIAVETKMSVDAALCRNESCEIFSKASIDFSRIEKLVSPVMSSKKSSHKRGYPSGGALYPVELFICSLENDSKSWPCPEKVLHLLPRSRSFEIVQGTEIIDDLKKSILSSANQIGTPSVAIIYTVYLPKTLFKWLFAFKGVADF